MARFTARRGVRARFDCIDFGVVIDLDVGPFALLECDLQYYVFSHPANHDVVRFTARGDFAGIEGRLGQLELSHEGARYTVEALCAQVTPHGDRIQRLAFEAQQEPLVRAPARERHGVEDLAAALLLDALEE